MSKTEFIEVVREGLSSLPFDLKAISRLADDPDLDDVSRTEAAGAAFVLLTGTNVIPGLRGVQGYIDDVLVMRLVCARIHARAPEVLAKHQEGSGLVSDWERHVEVTREFLGELVAVLEKAIDGVGHLKCEGYTAEDCIRDSEASNWLYESIIAAIVRLDFPEAEITRASKTADQIIPQLRARFAGKSI